MPLETIAAQAVYNLDLVNQTLAAIHHLFVQEHGGTLQRLTIRQAVLAALADSEGEGRGEGSYEMGAGRPWAREHRDVIEAMIALVVLVLVIGGVSVGGRRQDALRSARVKHC